MVRNLVTVELGFETVQVLVASLDDGDLSRCRATIDRFDGFNRLDHSIIPCLCVIRIVLRSYAVTCIVVCVVTGVGLVERCIKRIHPAYQRANSLIIYVSICVGRVCRL